MGKKFATELNEVVQKYEKVEDINIDELMPNVVNMNKKT